MRSFYFYLSGSELKVWWIRTVVRRWRGNVSTLPPYHQKHSYFKGNTLLNLFLKTWLKEKIKKSCLKTSSYNIFQIWYKLQVQYITKEYNSVTRIIIVGKLKYYPCVMIIYQNLYCIVFQRRNFIFGYVIYNILEVLQIVVNCMFNTGTILFNPCVLSMRWIQTRRWF